MSATRDNPSSLAADIDDECLIIKYIVSLRLATDNYESLSPYLLKSCQPWYFACGSGTRKDLKGLFGECKSRPRLFDIFLSFSFRYLGESLLSISCDNKPPLEGVRMR